MNMPSPLCTIPIYIPKPDSTFRHHGSAVLLQYRKRYYLATAAHVNDGYGSMDELLIATSKASSTLFPLSKQSISTVVPRSQSRRADIYDLALLPLPETEARMLGEVGLCAVGCDSLVIPNIKAGDELLFIGYPGSSQKFCHLSDGTWIEQQPVAVRVSQVVDTESESLGFPLTNHLVGRFRHPESRKPVAESSELLAPEGMSGGAVWHCTGTHMVFVGIITRWNQRGHLIATRTNSLLPMLEEINNMA